MLPFAVADTTLDSTLQFTMGSRTRFVSKSPTPHTPVPVPVGPSRDVLASPLALLQFYLLPRITSLFSLRILISIGCALEFVRPNASTNPPIFVPQNEPQGNANHLLGSLNGFMGH
jgi:hypothetical protein